VVHLWTALFRELAAQASWGYDAIAFRLVPYAPSFHFHALCIGPHGRSLIYTVLIYGASHLLMQYRLISLLPRPQFASGRNLLRHVLQTVEMLYVFLSGLVRVRAHH